MRYSSTIVHVCLLRLCNACLCATSWRALSRLPAPLARSGRNVVVNADGNDRLLLLHSVILTVHVLQQLLQKRLVLLPAVQKPFQLLLLFSNRKLLLLLLNFLSLLID